MRFRKFIKEMPHSTTMQRSLVKCPHGHNADLKADEFFYDYAAEMLGDDKWMALAIKIVGIFGNYSIPFPVACRKHEIVFMYDFKKKVGFAPRNDEERSMCEKLIKGLKNKEKNPHLVNKRFTIYEAGN